MDQVDIQSLVLLEFHQNNTSNFFNIKTNANMQHIDNVSPKGEVGKEAQEEANSPVLSGVTWELTGSWASECK